VLAAADPKQSMPVAAPIVGSIGLAFFLVHAFTLYSFIDLGWYDRKLNRQIKDAERPPPDEERDLQAIASQLAPMSMVNILAGTLAGIGASLFVANGRLRWPSSAIPYYLIQGALALTVLTGMALTAYIRRPRRSWVRDASALRSYLRQVNERGHVEESELIEIQKLRSRWKENTNAWPLRKASELKELGLELPSAHSEWNSPTLQDPVQFGADLRKEVNKIQVRRWIRRKRLWKLVIPPYACGLTLAGLIGVVIVSANFTVWKSALFYLPIVCGYTLFLYWIAFRIGRLDLVVTNRLFALERAQLERCDRLIEQIKRKHMLRQVKAGPTTGKLILRIGRWELRLRNDEV
jgi:hypothetical protein